MKYIDKNNLKRFNDDLRKSFVNNSELSDLIVSNAPNTIPTKNIDKMFPNKYTIVIDNPYPGMNATYIHSVKFDNYVFKSSSNDTQTSSNVVLTDIDGDDINVYVTTDIDLSVTTNMRQDMAPSKLFTTGYDTGYSPQIKFKFYITFNTPISKMYLKNTYTAFNTKGANLSPKQTVEIYENDGATPIYTKTTEAQLNTSGDIVYNRTYFDDLVI